MTMPNMTRQKWIDCFKKAKIALTNYKGSDPQGLVFNTLYDSDAIWLQHFSWEYASVEDMCRSGRCTQYDCVLVGADGKPIDRRSYFCGAKGEKQELLKILRESIKAMRKVEQ